MNYTVFGSKALAMTLPGFGSNQANEKELQPQLL